MSKSYVMDEKHYELFQEMKRKNWLSDKKCTDCVYYIENYKDDYTLRHFGYGEVKYRPACGHCNTYGFVSHNPAANCRYFEKARKKCKTT